MKFSEFPLFEYSASIQRDSVKAFARGEIRRQAGGHLVARFDRRGIVRGTLRTILQDDLKALDHELGHAYRRRQIIANGHPAWAYVYVSEDFDKLPSIDGARPPLDSRL